MDQHDCQLRLWWTIAKFLPAAVLTYAAITKVTNSPFLVESDGLLSHEPLLHLVIFFEISIAVCLLIFPASISWAIAVATFVVLLVIAVTASVAGIDCNCFGRSSHVGISTALDAAILVLCWICRPPLNSSTTWPAWHKLLVATLSGLVGVGFAEYHLTTTDKSNPISFLLAEPLVDQEWPLDSHISPALRELESGTWLILIVRSDCDHCKQLLATYFEEPRRQIDNERTAIFIAGSKQWHFAFDNVAIDAQPDGAIDWATDEPFVASPAVFEVIDGQVISAADGDNSAPFLAERFAMTSPLQ